MSQLDFGHEFELHVHVPLAKKSLNIILTKKMTQSSLKCLYLTSWSERWLALSSPWGLSNFSLLPFQKLCPSLSASIQILCPPSAVVPLALHPKRKDPLSVSGCLLALWSSMNSANCLRSGKFLCHRGTLISKARWSFTVAALSMWNCFFSQETQGFAPTSLAHRKKWPVARWKQAQISLILVITICFHHLCTLFEVLLYFFTVLVLEN